MRLEAPRTIGGAVLRWARRSAHRTGPIPPTGHTELLIEVPFVSELIPPALARRRHMIIDHHITLLDPFVPAAQVDSSTMATIELTIRDHAPFTYQLTAVRSWGPVLYLAVEPAEPFVRLRQAIVERIRPLAQSFPFVPHVTLTGRRAPSGLAERVAAALPISGRAVEVCLLVEDARGHRPVFRRFRMDASET